MSKGQNTTLQAGSGLGQSSSARECLLVILQPQLTLAKNLHWPLKGFISDGSLFRDTGIGDWTGFYDWLRDAAGNVIGVRYWLDTETEFLIDHTAGLSYIQPDPSRHVEIYFSDNRAVDPQLSGDQDFLYDAVFRSDDGAYAIGFGMGGLSETDLESLKRVETDWAVVQNLV